MLTRFIILMCALSFFASISCQSRNHSNTLQSANISPDSSNNLKTGAEQTEKYFPLLKGKKIGITTNQTGIIGQTHIVDSLFTSGFNIATIFAPEHGFRGNAEAGEKVDSYTDKKTGIRVVSLYGKHLKPSPEELKALDIMIFDIQDVGARFYTYISTLHYIMEGCAVAGIPLIILDRPNPNGFYVDGPVLDPKFRSFIGMHPIPVVHGMTVGEIAGMINGEGWLNDGMKCKITVIPVLNYDHTTLYNLPVAPSPNLQSMQAIYLYPSLCLFEGTVMSVGRGTDNPFEIFGHPQYPDTNFSFTPVSKPGFSVSPPYLNQKCFGRNLHTYADSFFKYPRLELQWLIDSYTKLGKKQDFFNAGMFDKLAGSSELRQMIIAGKTEEEIRRSWEPALIRFKAIRKNYLLYDDF